MKIENKEEGLRFGGELAIIILHLIALPYTAGGLLIFFSLNNCIF